MGVIDFDKLFAQFNGIKVGVIGDVMLDTYWWGHADRISPEAPVPVVALDKREFRIGGRKCGIEPGVIGGTGGGFVGNGAG